jgi:hypothetical protein
MPTDACQFFYECAGCGTRLRPKTGDCCVFSRDWLGSASSNLLAWWIPHAAMFAGLFGPAPIRAIIWTVALIWMGGACIANSKRCGRTHCRYTGPYYLAMAAPVLILGSGVMPSGIYEWIALGVLIVGGSKAIWWATERAWGKFS